MKKIILIISSVFLSNAAYCTDDFFIIVPAPAYMPETGFALFVEGVYKYRPESVSPGANPSMLQLHLAYTQMDQSEAYLEFNGYGANNSSFLKAVLQYKKFPDRFFGIGNNVIITDDSPGQGYLYTLETFHCLVEAHMELVSHLSAGARWHGQKSSLLSSAIHGALPGSEGGFDSGLGALLKWDDRDSVYFPVSGTYAVVSIMFFSRIFGAERDFLKWELDARKYFEFFKNHSVSLQALASAEAGDAPFYLMNTLGGDKLLRGYYKGALRDKSMAAIQAEYKWVFLERFVICAHAGIGAVEDEFLRLSTRYLRASFGLGLRFFIDEKDRITFRLDTGFTGDDTGLYLVAGEAF
ncbi:MAG TPA: BamA/TamA family outer membrane protein [Candidatus Goldiibacteriota bacterium]|nr:BamA/TamA family outer membrane protein [Candidatus Goldiibacteriota bacterium]